MSKKLASVALVLSVLFVSGALQAAYISESSLANGSFATSQHINSLHFTSNYDQDINTASGVNISESLSHVSINGTGDNTVDYYSFNGFAGLAYFDIDYAMNSAGSFDSWIELYDLSYKRLAVNDDSSPTESGSVHMYDSFLSFDLQHDDLYYIAIGRACFLSEIPLGADYVLHISQQTPVSAVPVPAAVWLFGSGLLALAGIARRSKLS